MAVPYDPEKYSNKKLRSLLFPVKTQPTSPLKSPIQQLMPDIIRPKEISEPPVYPWNKIGYHEQQNDPPNVFQKTEKTYAEAAEKAARECKTCQFTQPDLVPLGCSLISSGEELANNGRYLANHYRPFPGMAALPQGQAPVYVMEPNKKKNGGDNDNITPLFSHYNAELYQTPLDRSENMVSTGIMVNPWTGKVYETFEKALPPPTTSKYAVDADQLKRTNPMLIFMNGGIDPNRKPLSKQEICQDIPGADGGPNVWGSQLYTDQIGKRLKEYAESQIWNNRNGIYSCEPSFPKERPAGYVGLVNMLRPVPWLPPTQRASMDLKGWVGPTAPTYEGSDPMGIGGGR